MKPQDETPDFALDLYHQAGIQELIRRDAEKVEQAETRRLYGPIGYSPKWAIQTGLPHKDPGIVDTWSRENGDSNLTVQPFLQQTQERMPAPGTKKRDKAAPFHYLKQSGKSRKPVHFINHGIPYGPLPRLVLAYIGWYVVVYKRPDVDLGDDLSAFMSELGIVPKWGDWGTCDRLRDQIHRLATCQIAYTDKGRKIDFFKLVASLDEYWKVKTPDQKALWQNKLVLTHEAFMSYAIHRVPLNMATLRALKKSPLALDIYSWLSWRLFTVKEPSRVITYEMLANQFGSNYERLRNFKTYFDKELRKVLVEYRDAKVEAAPNGKGIVLLPSKTHVPALE